MDISAHTGSETSHSTSLPSIVTHKRESGHPIFLDDFSVLASGRSQLDTLIRESLLMGKINPFVNANISSFLLCCVDILYVFSLFELNPCPTRP